MEKSVSFSGMDNSVSEISERVKTLYDSGKSRDEIASELGLSSGSVRIYGNLIGINWSKKKLSRKNGSKKRLEEITSGLINGYSGETKIESSENNYSESQIVSEIRDAISGGAYSIKNIMEKTKYSYRIIKKYAKEAEIELPNGSRPSKIKDSDLDSMIEQGLSLNEIGEVYGVTPERARQIIKEKGKTEIYRVSRHSQTKVFKESERKKVLGEILGHLTGRINELVEKESWAYKKAIEYLECPRQNLGSRLATHSFDDLIAIFEKYETAQKNGQKISLHELSEGTNFSLGHVGRILNDVGVLPMHGDKWKGRTLTPKHKRDAVKRATAVEMSSADIAYFLGIPSYIVENNITTQGLQKKRSNMVHSIKQFGSRENHRVLTYRLASEIYEARDKCNFNFNETAEVLDVSPRIVNYAIEHRNEIEPVILSSLRILYNDANIKESYKKRDF